MRITKALREDLGDQSLRDSATANWTDREISVQVYSVSPDGQKRADYAQGAIKLYDRETCETEWNRMSYLVKRSIDCLQEKADSGSASRLTKGPVYRLFEGVIQYSDSYRAMEEVVLDSEHYEATARVQFQSKPGTNVYNPQDRAFLNHGWSSMRFLKEFSPDVTYQTYVRMESCSDSRWAGDVYVLEDDKIISVLGGLEFQAIKRKTLETILTLAQNPRPSQTSPPSSGLQKSAFTEVDNTSTKLPTIGLPADEASDDMSFEDYGVDSILSLTTTSRFQDELNINVDASFFTDNPTMRDFKRYFTEMTSKRGSNTSSSDMESSISISGGDMSSLATSPDDVLLIPEDYKPQDEQNKPWHKIRDIICEATGISAVQLQADTNLQNIGTGHIAPALNLDAAIPMREPADYPRKIQCRQHHNQLLRHPILQQPTKTLFLFPDGSGSAASYAHVKLPPRNFCVCALNSPYRTTPADYKCSLDSLTSSFVTEIRRRQPNGPYNLGGWSAGGLSAYDAVRSLIQDGEQVDRLFIIDSPPPLALEKMLPEIFPYFKSIGLLGDGKKAPPPWLVAHFMATVDAIDMYDMVPLKGDVDSFIGLPETYIVWAKDGVHGRPGEPLPDALREITCVPKPMSWILYDRTDLGPNGWDTLVGPENIGDIKIVDDAHHFSLLDGEGAQKLGAFISSAMAT
ncbi:hypothetical protein FE257_010281 [Aspergillus nanangensis]|uniref:Carrier domain-containing protein n=1 Tax=Aspergillus nanangensis TaxID=2582783 RepID=A0AAD4CIQ1_ASPNN|nr:hypothetical protein FE257_010281 [Aspergillus nanangensis]